jgi:hypothetical protein|nr:MAG TPA: hypothetical protein [Caudoviricetes sp.]
MVLKVKRLENNVVQIVNQELSMDPVELVVPEGLSDTQILQDFGIPILTKYKNVLDIIFDVTVRNPFLYDTQFESLIGELEELEVGRTYIIGESVRLRNPKYIPEGFEGDYVMVTFNQPITIREGEDTYDKFEEYHNNGIVEILKWQDVVHLNPNDFKKTTSEVN